MGNMSEKTRIFIAEDHTIVRQGLRALLSKADSVEVVGEAGDGMDAVRGIENLEPDLVLLDLSMPKMDGISVIKEIAKRCPATKILALTVHRDEENVLQAFKAGANGYCLKSAGQGELQLAIKDVLSGKTFVSSEISDKILEGYIETRKTVKKQSAFESLTQREKEVLKLVGESYRNKEISDYLCISVKTVEKHRSNIMEKLDLHSASGLTAYAIQKGLVNR